MGRLIFAGVFLLALSAGCVSRRMPAPAAIPPTTVAVTPAQPAPPSAPPTAAAPAAATVVPRAPSPPPVAAERPAKVTSAVRSRTTKPTPAPLPSAALKTPGPPATPPPAKPTLNLADLEQRLRETPAIGVFTKLSLKNQVDDLLNEFRSFYQGPNKHPTAALRQHYDLLLLKVLSLLQNADPPLAEAVASSREAIWGILADPEKFSKI